MEVARSGLAFRRLPRAATTSTPTSTRCSRDSGRGPAKAARGFGRVFLVAAAPHSPYTVSPRTSCGDATGCAARPAVMIHLRRDRNEARIVAEALRPHARRSHLDAAGRAHHRTIAAHCIHLLGGRRETLVAARGLVSHNPQSNMKISSGLSPVAERAARCLRALGTDGPAPTTPRPWEELRHGGLFCRRRRTGDSGALPPRGRCAMVTVRRPAPWAAPRGDWGCCARAWPTSSSSTLAGRPHLQPLHDVCRRCLLRQGGRPWDGGGRRPRACRPGGRIEGLDLESAHRDGAGGGGPPSRSTDHWPCRHDAPHPGA